MGARNEMEALPVPRFQSYSAARVLLAYLYGGAQLSGQTIELADSNFQAFASALTQELDGLKQGLAKDFNRQLYGTSAGKLATANAVGSTSTFVCSDAEALYLEIGMIVDIFTSGDVLRTGGPFEITNIVSSAGTTTVTYTPVSGTATASGDYMTRTSSRNKEMIGLSQIVAATGILFNIDPATVPVWKSVVDSNAGTPRPLSEGLMIQLADNVRKNGGNTTLIISNLGVRRQYFNLLVQQRRYSNEREFEGGFRGLAFATDRGDIPLVVDLDCQWLRMYFINEKELKLYQEGDWSFMNRDGSNWQRVIDSTGSYDAYATTMYKYCQFGTHRRNSHGVLLDISE
jgi:hypothetical protein